MFGHDSQQRKILLQEFFLANLKKQVLRKQSEELHQLCSFREEDEEKGRDREYPKGVPHAHRPNCLANSFLGREDVVGQTS